MTEIEKAYLEVKEQCDFIRSTAERAPFSKSAAVLKSFDLALAALREKQEREKNAPLTLEDLRGMDGEPVWVTPLGFWALVIATPGNRIKLICNDGETVWADKEIELVGPVYRRPPE